MCRLLSTRSILKLLFASLLLQFPALVATAQTDEPDLQKEKRLHNLYQKYGSSPTSNETWSSALAGKAQGYQIQSADTLWELSEVLFGDPSFWPKVWSLNAEKIENPHEIFPGQTLKFTMGTLAEPPSLAVAEKGEKIEEPTAEPPATPAPPDAGPIAAAEAAAGDMGEALAPEETDGESIDPKNQELMGLAGIPPEAPSKPVSQFPKSLPKWSFGRRIPKLELKAARISRTFAPSEEPLGYYITDQLPQSYGTITEGEMGQNTLAEHQYMVVRLELGMSQKRLVAIQELDEIKDPETKQYAKIVQVQGEVEILEVVNTKENLYRAIVKNVVNPIKVGATLVAESIPRFRGQVEGRGTAIARVIGGQHATQRRLLEPNALVYLAGSGLSAGLTYPVYKEQVARFEKSKSLENPQQIGAVKVVKVANGFATGVVVEEREEIHVGDITDPHMHTEK
jgi:hypothetical protein